MMNSAFWFPTCNANSNLTLPIISSSMSILPSLDILYPEPRNPVALTDKGTQLKLMGRVNEGLQYYNEAIKVDSTYAPAYYNIAVVLSEQERYEDALAYYHTSILYNPSYVDAYGNIGVIYKTIGKLNEAISFYERALLLNPTHSISNNNLSIALTDLGTKLKHEGKLKEAIHLYQRALTYNSKYAEAYYNLGVIYGEKGKFNKAIYSYNLAINFNPKCVGAYNNLGVIYKDRDDLVHSIQCYREALNISPYFVQAQNNLAVVYTLQGKFDEAYDNLQAAIRYNPGYAEAYNNLGVLYRDIGNIPAAIESYNKCLSISPLSRNAGQNLLLAMNYLNYLPKKVYNAHVEWGILFSQQFKQYTTYNNDITSDRIIRIGYISPDFFTHSVSYFIDAILENHNNDTVFVICYSNVAKEDTKTIKFKDKVSLWRNIYTLGTEETCKLIRKDQVDILIDLAGHTSGNRMDVMAMKPAPVQVTYIGYPNTTGLPQMDYRLTDDVVDPSPSPSLLIHSSTTDTIVDTFSPSHSSNDVYHTEKLVRLPHIFLCYTPAKDTPSIFPPPSHTNGFISFGTFNNLAKITGEVLEVWADILTAVPHSRLVLKSKPFESETIKKRFYARLEKLGIETHRVDMLPLTPLNKDHLATYRLIDISLDPWPYSGTTTTCESIWMGCPVVTFMGSLGHASRVSGAILLHLGLYDLVAHSTEEYVRIAVELANSPKKLKQLRNTLRNTMYSSYMCNGEEFTNNLEQIFVDMWVKYCSGRTAILQETNTHTKVAKSIPHRHLDAKTIFEPSTLQITKIKPKVKQKQKQSTHKGISVSTCVNQILPSGSKKESKSLKHIQPKHILSLRE